MNTVTAEPAGIKGKLAHEVRRLLLIFAYLAAFFLLLRLYTRLVLSEYRISHIVYGLTLLKALALAKVVLTGESLRLGERFRARPLIVPTLYKTAVFSAFALAFEVVEHFIIGWVHGKGSAQVWAELMEKGWPHVVTAAVVVYVAFLPFFAFREMDRVLGVGRLRDLFLKSNAGSGERQADKAG
jgi:hypothetical protein